MLSSKSVGSHCIHENMKVLDTFIHSVLHNEVLFIS